MLTTSLFEVILGHIGHKGKKRTWEVAPQWALYSDDRSDRWSAATGERIVKGKLKKLGSGNLAIAVVMKRAAGEGVCSGEIAVASKISIICCFIFILAARLTSSFVGG
ncbi:unnamed protein product, partial [Brenthis ino]